MPQVLAAVASRRNRKPREPERERLVQARAEFVSLGGAVLLAVCLVFTAILIMVFASSNVTGPQRFIALVLVVASWAYFFNSITERLSLTGQEVVFKAALSRTRIIPLDELRAMLLIHEGLNLERGIETLEFRRAGKQPDRVSLGPCWQRNKLEAFLRSVEKALQAPKIFANVR